MSYIKIILTAGLVVLIVIGTTQILTYVNLQKFSTTPKSIFFKNSSPVQTPPKNMPTQKNNPNPQKPITKKYKHSWGVYTGDTASSLASFQQQINKQPDISASFVGWGDNFPTDVATPLKQSGQTLLIFWEPTNTTLDQIISGSTDPYISQFASDAKNYENSIILVPMPEMNGNWDSWDGTATGNTPAKYIQAYKHIHDLFSGVQNVKFGWAVNNDSVPDTPENAIANYYPGDNYVDYVGVDGFNFGDPWQSYSEIFSKALQQLKIYNKPIYIFSMACAQGPQKAAWITDAISQIQSNPDIVGWVWFNTNKEQNWLINSDPASLQAFQNSLN